MNEIAKTAIFAAVAVLVLLIAWASRPSLPVQDSADMRGKELFPDFENPLEAASLEIVKYDEATASEQPFKVAQVDNRWSIPSHSDYPADAEDQVAEAAAGLMDLKVLDVSSDSPGDHELYGVIDPDPKTLKRGATGVGTRVTMRNKDDKLLLSLIVGQEVPGRDGLRYVRRTGQDPVYIMAVKTDKLSTQFEDWIEKDLLKLSSWDIKRIQIHDYSIDELRGLLNMRRRIVLGYDNSGDPKWTMTSDQIFGQEGWVEAPTMADDEELDTDQLDGMTKSLDDLKIVDVRRKPEGLSADLKAGDAFGSDPEAAASLESRGFYKAKLGDQIELFSNEGEIRCLMKDGVKYVLRFGDIAGTGTASSAEEEGEEGQEDSGDSDASRYLLVMAQFDPTIIPPPKLETPPEEKPAAESEAATGEAAATEETPGDETAGEETAGEETEGEETAGEETEGEEPAADEAGTEDAEPEKSAEEIKAERERIEKENQREREEYEKKIEEGEKRVNELNARFADWYYVISDKVYQEIHLGRKEIVKQKEKKEDEAGAGGEGEQAGEPGLPQPEAGPPQEEGFTPADFERLKQEGLEQAAEPVE